MFYIRDYIKGILLFPIILSLVIASFLIYGGTDLIKIDILQSYKQNYNTCQQEQKVLMEDFMELKETKNVVCEYKESGVNFWMPFWAFLIGVISTGYVILVFYPMAKNKLEERRNPHKKK